MTCIPAKIVFFSLYHSIVEYHGISWYMRYYIMVSCNNRIMHGIMIHHGDLQCIPPNIVSIMVYHGIMTYRVTNIMVYHVIMHVMS